MSAVSIGGRFLQTTRGQIIVLLRRSTATVEDLARSLGLTDNAIRSHLATLERDGLVRQEGVRRTPGAGKPAVVYEIHPDAEPLFSRAYAPVLSTLLDELAEQLPVASSEALMRAVGRRLANAVAKPSGDRAVRVEAAVALLNSLGGAAQLERSDQGFVIRGCGGCPLSLATARRPELCRAVESLLSEFVGAPVQERCDRGERPRCHFEVPTAA